MCLFCCTLHTAYCILHTAYCILHTAYCILHSAHFTLLSAVCLWHFAAGRTFEDADELCKFVNISPPLIDRPIKRQFGHKFKFKFKFVFEIKLTSVGHQFRLELGLQFGLTNVHSPAANCLAPAGRLECRYIPQRGTEMSSTLCWLLISHQKLFNFRSFECTLLPPIRQLGSQMLAEEKDSEPRPREPDCRLPACPYAPYGQPSSSLQMWPPVARAN